MERARSALARRRSWPAEWQHSGLPTESQFILYITPEEAREFGAEVERLYRRFEDRLDHPERRPDGALVLLAEMYFVHRLCPIMNPAVASSTVAQHGILAPTSKAEVVR